MMPKLRTESMLTETMVAIHNLKCQHGYMPTKQELATHLGLSYCAIQNRLKKLESAGFIGLDTDRNSRGIQITAKTVNFNGISVPVLGECN